jgi:hypothetical protein
MVNKRLLRSSESNEFVEAPSVQHVFQGRPTLDGNDISYKWDDAETRIMRTNLTACDGVRGT